MQYKLEDFDYDCPPESIAQHPTASRDESRLLVMTNGRIEHRTFREFPTFLRRGDLVVINTSRVIRARLKGMRQNGREAEVLLVHPEPDGTWQAMVHPGGKLKVGRTVTFGSDAQLTIEDVLGGGLRRVSLSGSLDWNQLMHAFGDIPLPPYITRTPEQEDESRYQTVYAKVDGSVAAPTAGLHFTDQTLAGIRESGAQLAELVLHVGPGTFKPVQDDRIEEHHMHHEWYSVSTAAAEALNQTRERGGRVIAVGTTVARVLETLGKGPNLTAQTGWTNLFIHPPYEFQVVTGLLTNFHLPRSTLLMLVCAFGGYESVMQAYREAVKAGYRFYSYGDAMLAL